MRSCKPFPSRLTCAASFSGSDGATSSPPATDHRPCSPQSPSCSSQQLRHLRPPPTIPPLSFGPRSRTPTRNSAAIESPRTTTGDLLHSAASPTISVVVLYDAPSQPVLASPSCGSEARISICMLDYVVYAGTWAVPAVLSAGVAAPPPHPNIAIQHISPMPPFMI